MTTSTLADARAEFARRLSSADERERATMISIATYPAHQNRYLVPVYSHTTIREVIESLPDEDVGDVILVVLDEPACRFIGAKHEERNSTNLKAFLRDLDALETLGSVDRQQLRWVNSTVGKSKVVTRNWTSELAPMTPRPTGWKSPHLAESG